MKINYSVMEVKTYRVISENGWTVVGEFDNRATADQVALSLTNETKRLSDLASREVENRLNSDPNIA